MVHVNSQMSQESASLTFLPQYIHQYFLNIDETYLSACNIYYWKLTSFPGLSNRSGYTLPPGSNVIASAVFQ